MGAERAVPRPRTKPSTWRNRVARRIFDGKVHGLARDVWVLQPAGGHRRRIRVNQLDDRAWIVQRRGPGARSLTQVGRRDLRTHMLVDQQILDQEMSRWQQAVGGHLGEQYLNWLLQDMQVDLVIDVGANEGQFGRRLRAGGYAGRIVSFEPVAAVAERLRQRTADDPKWDVHQLALGEEDVSASIHVATSASASKINSLLPASDFGARWSPGLRETEEQQVEVRRLDGLWDHIAGGPTAPRVFLKMDTQGFDLPAFRGANGVLDQIVAMQSEVAFIPLYDGMPRISEQLAVYEEAGFETSGIFPVSRHAPTRRLLEADLVMVRPGC